MWSNLSIIFPATFALVYGLTMAKIIPVEVLQVFGLFFVPVSIFGIIRTWSNKGPKAR